MKQKNLILMVVAVGCGLVAAFLTSQMSAKSQSDTVEVVVAAKDLPVGTMLSREELKTAIKMKRMPKDGLPPAYVVNPEELVDKRLSRPVRAEETINPQDLTKGGSITLPEGKHMTSLQVSPAQAAAGFVGPGSRVDIHCTVRHANKVRAFTLLTYMLVIAVDTNTTYTKDGTFPQFNTVSFAVTKKESLLISLAKSCNCTMELMLRNPKDLPDESPEEREKAIDEVIKLLQDEKKKADLVGGESTEGNETKQPPKNGSGNGGSGNGGSGNPTTQPTPTETPMGNPYRPETPPAPPLMRKILIANRDIAPNTMVTKDLAAEAFELKELPAEFGGDAMSSLEPAYGQAFKTGVSKGQWVTYGMVGLQKPKDVPQEEFYPARPGTVAPNPGTPVKQRTYDVAIHTASGTTIVRYAEVAPGKWKKVAELTPEQAAQPDKPEKPAKPEASKEGEKKVD